METANLFGSGMTEHVTLFVTVPKIYIRAVKVNKFKTVLC